MHSRIVTVVVIIAAYLSARACAPLRACEICGQPTVTLAERFALADAALVVRWRSARLPTETDPGNTVYEIVEVLRNPGAAWKEKKRILVKEYFPGAPGDLKLLMAGRHARNSDAGAAQNAPARSGAKPDSAGSLGADVKPQDLKWDFPPLPVTQPLLKYIVEAPLPEKPAEERLLYFLGFLEHPEIEIANDAFAEFVNAPNPAIVAVAPRIPLGKLRQWFESPKTPITRIAAYGMMLGICGGPEEARLLERTIESPQFAGRPGTEGATFGYLLLAGEAGLNRLDKLRFGNQTASPEDVFPAWRALQYYSSYGNGKISKDRLRLSMRLLLGNDGLAESAITDLARWKDWEIQDQLTKHYGTGVFEAESTRQTIVRFLIAATMDLPEEKAENPPPHVLKARKNIDLLRARDPAIVAIAEKDPSLR
jgi:hypothetical protein